MEAQRMTTQGYVLGPSEGEHLVRNSDGILIKVAPTIGSNNMALGARLLFAIMNPQITN
jgi:hypothetical protein